MVPFDKKAIRICEKYKCTFFECYRRIEYGEYVDKSYIRKSLPGMIVENNDELQFITDIVGKEYIKIVNKHYIEFFDPNVVEYIKATAPICNKRNGTYTYTNKMYTCDIPSKDMLEAAELIYGVIQLSLMNKLAIYRENKFNIAFQKNTLDGFSAIIPSSLHMDNIPDDFIVLIKKRYNDSTMFFVIRKKPFFRLYHSGAEHIEITVPAEYYDIIAARKENLEKRLKISIVLIKKE